METEPIELIPRCYLEDGFVNGIREASSCLLRSSGTQNLLSQYDSVAWKMFL